MNITEPGTMVSLPRDIVESLAIFLKRVMLDEDEGLVDYGLDLQRIIRELLAAIDVEDVSHAANP